MTAASGRAEYVETFRGTPDGSLGVTLVDGHVEKLTLPASAIDPGNAAVLGTTLVELLNEALDAHMSDILSDAAPGYGSTNGDIEAVERFVARAVADAEAAVASSRVLQRDLEASLEQPEGPEVVGHSADREVEAVIGMGQLTRITISERLLYDARPAHVASAVLAAVNEALSHVVVDHQDLIESLSPDALAAETREVARRIARLKEGTP